MSISAILRHARLSRGWKQKDVVERSDFAFTEKGYPKIDSGEQSVSVGQFILICKIFGIEPEASIDRSYLLAAHLHEIAEEPLDVKELMRVAVEWLAEN